MLIQLLWLARCYTHSMTILRLLAGRRHTIALDELPAMLRLSAEKPP